MFGARTTAVLLILAAAWALIPSHLANEKGAASKTFSAAEVTFFEKEVRPILEKSCFKCHGEGKIRGGLRLSSRAGVLKGGDSGPVVSLDKPEASRLVKAINYQGDLEMPPTGKLPQKDIDTLTRWVKAGLPWTPGEVPVKPGHAEKGGKVTPESRMYWAYQPLRRPAVPQGSASPPTADPWVRNPIDAFILAKLRARGLAPNPPADRAALVRRAYYDLLGLPPTPEEVDAFVNDSSPDAYERLLDKLLASPHYGEKWGRHWLDLVRFAETNGYERDGPKPFAWRYRDYVIKSFNQDKPFDRFIREQIAGDELAAAIGYRPSALGQKTEHPQPTPAGPQPIADLIIATGYYRLGLWDDEPVDPKQSRYDELDDIVATTSQVFLGMTMNCARCHDHKIDPIPQRDYYQMLAFFQDIEHYSKTREVRSPFNLTDITPPEKRSSYEGELKEREARLEELARQMTVIEEEAIKKMPTEDQRAAEGLDRPQVVQKVPMFLDEPKKAEYAKLKKEAEELKRKPTPSQELALSVNRCLVHPPQTHVLIRGNPHAPGAKVEPAFPEVLGASPPIIPVPSKEARSSGRRTVLADWIASKDNPLTARVLANRLWQHHFGRGIVASANDFGKFGTPPTHPELLDWLARELVDPTWTAGQESQVRTPESGVKKRLDPGTPDSRLQTPPDSSAWTLKRMHKLIMLSNTYRMSSRANDAGLKADAPNTLFWRFQMRRLTAEEVRDSVLAVSGKLNPKMGGPGIYPPIPKEVLAGQSRPGEGWGKSPPEEASRRSVYIHIKRSLLVPILSQHDAADTDLSCPVRYTTTVPTQSLGMLNSEFATEQAAAMAQRLQKEAPGNLDAQVRRAIRLTTGRQPAAAEVERDIEFINDVRAKAQLSDAAALKQYCLMALNANEFVYLD